MPSRPRAWWQRRNPSRALDEMRLLHEAGATHSELTFDDLSAPILARITRERGVDFATALFYDRLRRSPDHGPFIARVEAIKPKLENLPGLKGKVLVAPAAFHREFPGFGGDGLLVRQIAGQFGLQTGLLPVASVGSVRDNACAIVRTLEEEPEPVILVSLSKGGADVRLALEELERQGRAQAKVRIWVQICGLIHGCPLVNDGLDGSLWRRSLGCAYVGMHSAGKNFLPQLRHGPGALLFPSAHAPRDVPVINVVACPLQWHLSGNVRTRHQQLARFGPNDGSTPLIDAIVEPGEGAPSWVYSVGADHYFRVPGVSRLLYQLFTFIVEEGI